MLFARPTANHSGRVFRPLQWRIAAKPDSVIKQQLNAFGGMTERSNRVSVYLGPFWLQSAARPEPECDVTFA